jgi:hypothetical protein
MTAATAATPQPRAVVLVEGESDAEAVRAAALLLGRDLVAERVDVVALGGATGVRRWLSAMSLTGVPVVGLCDERESAEFARALEGSDGSRVFVCRADLEDELIRALGTEAVEGVLAEQDDLGSFRTLQSQPAHLGRPVEGQLRRWLGAGSGRKIRYGRLLVEALTPGSLPEPLRALIDGVAPQR